MKKFFEKNKSVILIWLAVALMGALTYLDRSYLDHENLLTNPGFESGKAAWTSSGGSFLIDTNTVHGGFAAGKMSLTGTTGCIIQDATVAASKISGQNLEYGAWVNVPTASASLAVQVCARNAGGTVGTCTSAIADSNYHYIPINYPGPASGTVGVSVCSTVSGTGNFLVDDGYVGEARNLSQVSQAQLVGTITWAATAGCVWSGSAASYTAFAAQASCPAPTVTGNVSAPATKIPSVTINSGGPGAYFIVAHGDFFTDTAGNDFSYAFNDGTSTFGNQGGTSGTGGGASGAPHGQITYSSAISSQAIQIEGKRNTGGSYYVDARNVPLTIEVYYYPSQSQVAVNSDQGDFGWTSYTPTFSAGWGTVSNVNFRYRRVEDSMEVQGYFTAGTVAASLAQISLPGSFTSDSSYHADEVIGEANRGATSALNSYTVLVDPSAGNVEFGAKNQSGISPLTEQNASNVFSTGDNLSLKFKVKISGWTSNQRAPSLIGSVTSSGAGTYHTEGISIANNGTLSISSQSGSWASLNSTTPSNGGGQLNFTTGEFSAAPWCTCTVNNLSGSDNEVCSLGDGTANITATSIQWRVASGAGAYQNDPVSIICMGPH